MSDLGSATRLSVDVDLTGYQVSPAAAPVRPVTGDEPLGLWLDLVILIVGAAAAATAHSL